MTRENRPSDKKSIGVETSFKIGFKTALKIAKIRPAMSSKRQSLGKLNPWTKKAAREIARAFPKILTIKRNIKFVDLI